jgi:hypothetical protein
MKDPKDAAPSKRLDFMTAFCQAYQCAPEQYKEKAFWLCLHRRAVPFARLLRFLSPRFFDNDFALLEEAGKVIRYSELLAVINQFRQDCQVERRYLHDQLRLRVSGRRVCRVFARLVLAGPNKETKT